MEEFPVLKSGGRVQYPVRRGQDARENSVDFWGGGSQTYLRKKTSELSWTLKYVGLSEEETSQLLEFCERHGEDSLYFSFRDPITGTLYNQCVVEPSSIVVACEELNAYEFAGTIRRIEE